jgi:hypothetical protein
MLWIWKFLRGVAAKLLIYMTMACSQQPWLAEQRPLPTKSMVFQPRRGTIDKEKLEGRSRGSGRGAHLRWKETEDAGFCRRAAGDGGESRLGPAWRRRSRGRPTMGTSRICAARPSGAPGVVVFTWRCFVAANRRGQRRRRRRLTRLQRRRRGKAVARAHGSSAGLK